MDDHDVLQVAESCGAGGGDEQAERVGEPAGVAALAGGKEQQAVAGQEAVGAVEEAGPGFVDGARSSLP
ncbi:hypothetical protein ACFZDP_05010 [Streptomyces mirabilis]|uniref:hypothetical protein n=1 Tax=Streptomyces mirabilis TaxID=68239 RepID=UPI0036F144FB